MEFISGCEIAGAKADGCRCKTRKGAPTAATKGDVGTLYMDEDTGEVYKCTKCENGIYTWEPFTAGTSSPTGGAQLPPVTEGDNGKVLKVIDGAWAAADAVSLLVEVDGEVYDLGTIEIEE